MSGYLDRRRQRVASAWNLSREVVLVGAGEMIGVPGGADRTYPFLSHSEYFYLADRECPGAVLAFDDDDGWTDFVPEVTEAERIWDGAAARDGTPLSALPGWLAARRGRPVLHLGSPLPGVRSDAARSEELRVALTHARRPKDEVELERMRRAAAATAAGFEVATRTIRPGISERQVQIEIEAEFFRGGGDRTAYDTIVGSGANAAVLHFQPTARTIGPGDPVLIDAGAEVGRYACDVTRTYRAEGRSSPAGGSAGSDPVLFRELYALVLAVEDQAIRGCTPGTEFRDLHLAASRQIAEGLIGIGILRGDADSLVEQDAHALFFPHGLGHLVGLGVRDASGRFPGRPPSALSGVSRLRTDLPLEVGYVTTIEPGIYFIRALLEDPDRRGRYREAVDWRRVDGLLGFGGIRIEDNVLVTANGPEVLTRAIPKGV